MTTHGATTVSQHVLQTLAANGEPITINELLKLIHARYYEDEIIYRGIILTLINLGEVDIDGSTMLLSLPGRCTCGDSLSSCAACLKEGRT